VDARLTGLLLAVLLLATAPPAAAQGTATRLRGRATLAVPGCGVDRDRRFAVAVSLHETGAWGGIAREGPPFGGTWASIGRRGRSFDLFFHAESESDLAAGIVQDVRVLCGIDGPVTVLSLERKRFRLRLNRRHTRARLVLRYVFRGTAGGRGGVARYRVRVRGRFEPAE
jgi:hypothetical protein